MLTDSQKKLVLGLIGQGYKNSGQIAKLAGLTHEYVEAYMEALSEEDVSGLPTTTEAQALQEM